MPQYKWMKLIIVCLTVVLPVCFMMSCKNSDIKINEQQKDSEITGFDAEFKFSAEGGQGSAVFGDTFFACSSRGACAMYDMNTGEKIAAFDLASATEDNSHAYSNHSNQVMFGAEKFKEDDPFPLMYVTTGNSGEHDSSGAYYAKCAIERVLHSEEKGWYSELVMLLEFNDMENIPNQTGNVGKNMNVNKNMGDLLTNMYDSETGKFLYVDGNGYEQTKGYQKVSWGWPAWFTDCEPTEVTAGKIYLKGARFRTTEAYEALNKEVYGIESYWTTDANQKGNAYIVTEFNMPPLPKGTSASDGYGATFTLYPKDITDQFTTEYDIGFTQGGVLYKGVIYYSYGNEKNESGRYRKNGIQIIDIASKKITEKLNLSGTVLGLGKEPECCSIWKGELMLGLNGDGYEVYNIILK